MKKFANLVSTAAFVLTGFAAGAATIFDDSSAYNTYSYQVVDGQQFGNEVTLGSGWYLTNFQFEYYSPNSTLPANLGLDVRFYLNNGPLTGGVSGYPTPGTLIYDSGWFLNTVSGNIPGGSNDISYASSDLYNASTSPYTTGGVNLNTGLAGNVLPGDFTFSITFTNLGADTIYLPLANSTANTNYGTYWLYNNLSSQWSLLTNSQPANALVIFQGTPTPEPSMLGLGAVGSLLLVGVSKLKRKR